MDGTPPPSVARPREQPSDSEDALRRLSAAEDVASHADTHPMPFPGHLSWMSGLPAPPLHPNALARHPLVMAATEAGAVDEARGRSATLTLENANLWRKFHRIGTEMIITKTGRRMFPALQISAAGLDPEEEYYFILELALASTAAGAAELPSHQHLHPSHQHHRLRFSGQEWVVAGRGEAQAPPGSRIYIHPDSPATGAQWMNGADGAKGGNSRRRRATISFSKVKLTNNSLDKCGHVVLTSMHKYIPRIRVVKASDYMSLAWLAHDTMAFSFPETEFVAVTAYQNGKITKLKIDHNPFAKGFRETGMSKSKRKLEQMMMKMEDEDDQEHSTEEEEETPRKSPCLDHNNNGSDSGRLRTPRTHSVQSLLENESRASRSPTSSPEGSQSSSCSRSVSVSDEWAADPQANPIALYDPFSGFFPLLWASFAEQARRHMATYSPQQQHYTTQLMMQQPMDHAMSRLSHPSLLQHQPLIMPWKVAPLHSTATSYDCFSPNAINPYLQHNFQIPYPNLLPFTTANLPSNLEKSPYLLDLSSKHSKGS